MDAWLLITEVIEDEDRAYREMLREQARFSARGRRGVLKEAR